MPIPTSQPAAPEIITELVECRCVKSKCVSRCSCKQNNLNLSELCTCGADDDLCENAQGVPLIEDESDYDE